MADSVKFLGTAGARFVMARQLRSSAGVWYSLRGFQFLLDPGPGTLVRCAASRPRLDPLQLDAVVLSHKHLDHSGDVNVIIEAMTDGGFKKRGRLFCPREALDDDPVVLRYLRGFLAGIVPLEEGGRYELAPDLALRTPLRHLHSAETYGLRLEMPGLTIGHIVDTLYFDRLAEAYAGCQVLVLHVVRLKKDEKDNRDIQHLTLDDARRLIAGIRPRVALLTHFGMTMLRAKPWELARQLSEETGVEVHASSDGATFQL
jgi:ribonuclease BN (tRNA processing enzyme)